MANPTLIPVAGVTGYGSVVSYQDTAASSTGTYYYAVQAINNAAFNGYDATGAMLIKTISSAWSNVVGVGLPAASITPTSLTFADQVVHTTSAAMTLSLSNVGGGTLHLVSIVASGNNPADFAQTNNCANVASAASCTISVKFTPGALGARSATYTITTNDLTTPTLTVQLSGSGIAAVAAAMLTPTPGGPVGATQIFTWSAGLGNQSYQLLIGTTGVGSQNTYNSGTITTTTSASITLPTGGGTLFVRLSSVSGGVTTSYDYTYTESGTVVAPVFSPTSGKLGATQVFSWTAGSGIQSYQVYVGTTGVGSSNVYNSGPTGKLLTPSITIPQGGGTLFVRFTYQVSGVMHPVDYTFTEPGTPVVPVLNSPPPSTALTGGTAQVFAWTTGAGIQSYQFKLGSTGVGSSNLYVVTGTSATSTPAITLPAAGRTLYARLYWEISNVWYQADYTYTTK
jgi:hypothetical protein